MDDLNSIAAFLGRNARRVVNAVDHALDRDPYHVVGYRSYGTAERALLLGRVVQNDGLAAADAGSSRWRNLLDTIKRVHSEPLPFAQVRARLRGAERHIVADDEGFLRQWVEVDSPLSHGWHDAELELTHASLPEPSRAAARVLVPSAAARFGVVSDLDDTVIQSQVANFLRAAQLLLFENARTRLPFPGVAAFYRALAASAASVPANPIFYVSSSPWNLYDVIADFLDGHAIPTGPTLLRDWDLGRALLKNREHKLALIRDVLTTYPSLPFILIGDSSQEDPEIYAELVREHPERVLAIYIRNVTTHPERSTAIRTLADSVQRAGSTLVLADDTLAAARHAAAHGWIAESSLPEIAGDKRADEGQTGEKVETPGVETKPPAPTVVVDDEVKAKDVEG